MRKIAKARILPILYIVTFTLIIAIVFLILQLNTESIKGYDKLSETTSKKLSLIIQMRKNADEVQIALFSHVLDSTIEGMKFSEYVIIRNDSINDGVFKEYQKLIKSTEEQIVFNKLLEARKFNKAIRDTLVKLDYINGTDLRKSINFQKKYQQKSYEQYQTAINEFADFVQIDTDNAESGLDDLFNKSIYPIMVCIGFLIIILVILGFLIKYHLDKLRFQNKLTEEKEKALLNEKLYNESILCAAPDGIVGINEKGLICIFNTQAEKIFGYNKAEAIGQPLSILLPEQFNSTHENFVFEYFNKLDELKLRAHPLSLTSVRKNGEIFPSEISLSHTDTIQGKIAIAGVRDITEKQKTEKRLQQLADINEHSKAFVGIATIDRKIIYLNPSSRKALGILPEENITGYTTIEIYPERIRAKMANAVKETIANGIWVGESELQSKDGRIIPVIQTIMLHKDEYGKPEFTSTTMIEISDLKNKEYELIRINKLFRALSNATKLLVTLNNKEDFYKRICDVIVDIGGLKLSWIGEYNPDTAFVDPVGWGGEAKNYLEGIKLKVEPQASIKGPAATAMLTGEPQIVNDFYATESTLQWQETARKFDIGGCIVIPIKLYGVTIGTLNVYSAEKDYFQEKEESLLIELGSIISLGIEIIQEEKERLLIEANTKKLNTIIEHTKTYVSITNMDSSYIYMNDAARIAFGFEPDEDITKYYAYDVFTPDCAKMIREIVIPDLLINGIWEGEVEFKSRKGNVFNGLLVTVLHKDKNGNPLYRSSTCIDITEQKKKEKDRNRLAEIIDKSSTFIGIANLDGSIKYLNNSFKELLAIKQGNEVSEFKVSSFHNDSNCVPISTIWEKIVSEGMWLGENILTTLNGKHIPVMQTIVLHRDEHGEPEFTSSTAVDISKLEEKKTELKYILELMNNSNAFVGIANMNSNFVYLNKAARKAFEITVDEDITKLSTFNFHTESSYNLLTEIRDELQINGVWCGETEMVSRSGRIIPTMQTLMVHYNAKGEREFTSTTAIDISELKHKESQLVSLNDELRSLYNNQQQIREDERKTIAKEIHDELGQNLTALKLYISWIKVHMDSDKEAMLKKLIEFEKITNETVNTSRRLYNNLYPQMLNDVGIVGALQWLLSSYKATAEIDYEFNTNISFEESLTINTTISLAIFRVYQECFNNILRYAKANLVIINFNIENGLITLSIEDDGVGFDINNIDTKIHHGLIGMRERVHSLNGMITIESSIGKGTKTTINFPFEKGV